MPPVVIDYFYEAGCPDCYRVRDQVMPELRERFEGFYWLNQWDIGIRTNVMRLIAYQEKLRIRKNEPVCMIVDYRHVFNGFGAIKTGLLERVEKSAEERMEPGWKVSEPIPVPDATGGTDVILNRLKSFTLWMVLAAGLLDGINPCAISTLVFFMSLLAVSGVSGRAC